MIVCSYLYRNGDFEKIKTHHSQIPENFQLVLGFGSKKLIADPAVYQQLKKKFNAADMLLCSTAGEIFDTETTEHSISLAAISFARTAMQTAFIRVSDYINSYEAGKALMEKLPAHNLKHVFVISDGSLVNGSELVRGIENVVAHSVPVTGGLAGDDTSFDSTLVGLNSIPSEGTIAAIGFYGDAFMAAHGTMGGWDVFGLEKTVTKSESNTLYQIDNKNALDLYKQYLGKYADDLPGSALLFPLSVQLPGNNEKVVRTILSINNETNSMVFAGDVPVGSKVRFMRANFDNLIDAASVAAQKSLVPLVNQQPKLAILISCVGRKIILNKRVDEEVEAVKTVLGNGVILTGFYSYGEISPINPDGSCQLHNQTMTITTFNELE